MKKQNMDIHAQIDDLQNCIEQLKSVDIRFVERDNFSMPQVFDELRTEFETSKKMEK